MILQQEPLAIKYAKKEQVEMELIELTQHINSEEQAAQFLRSQGVLRNFTNCIYCNSTHIGLVRKGKYKCYTCHREWSQRKGSVIENMRIPFTKFVLAIKMFELEVPVLQAHKELKLAYNTTYKLYMKFRAKIYVNTTEKGALEGEIEADESYFGGKRKGKRGRGAANKIPVFGILERGGEVTVEIVKDVKAETLLKETIRKVKRGSLIYTDRFRSYDGLVMYGFRHERIDHSKRFANGKVYINGIEGFWSYAKGKLMKYHGLTPKYFPYYLKELEYRYNHRNDDIFDLMLGLLESG